MCCQVNCVTEATAAAEAGQRRVCLNAEKHNQTNLSHSTQHLSLV